MKLGQHMGDEQKAKISIALLGKTKSPETLAKMSIAQKGHVRSTETREKLSAAKMGNKNALGHHLTDETKARLSAMFSQGGITPEKYRGYMRKSMARRRGLEYHPLNESFQVCDGHHLSDGKTVINIPRWMHRGKGNYHNHNTGQGMTRMDVIAYNYLFKQEAEAALRVM